MMLEQSLISPNFLGRESFRWFIGVVSEYCQVQESNVGGGYKAKVRIIGYHPDTPDKLKEDELPWAHVLVPLNMGTGTGGVACYNIPRGGETVIGFFLDGDNAQQPVIIGGLFSGYNIEHPNTFKEGTKGYNPFRPEKSAINSYNRSSKTGKTADTKTKAPLVPDPEGNITRTGDNGKQEKESAAAKNITDVGSPQNTQTVTIPASCKSSSSTYSKILQTLRNFIRTLNSINQLTSLIADIPGLISSLIQEVTQALTDLFSDYIKYVRDQVIKAIYKWLKDNVIDKIFGKDAKLLKQLATDKVIDGIWCAFRKVLNGIVKFITDFLTQIVNKVVSFPLCAAEALVGSVMSTITNEIMEAIGPALQEFSSALGGVIGTIESYVSLALGYANTAVNFLSCESAECKQALNYEMNKGFINEQSISNIRNIINYPSQVIRNGGDTAREWLEITNGSEGSEFGSCNAVNLECGLPTVEIFGGGGVGAAGFAVVDAIGQVSGVNLTNFGSGYTSAPYVSIVDACGNGTGAQATAIIDENGSVSQVYMDDTGSGYLNATNVAGTSTAVNDPCSINPIDESGSEVVGTIVGVNIVRPGIGYTSGDLIFNSTCDSDVEIYPVVDSNGRIVGTNIVNPGTSIRVFPELSINTQDGEGAILRPILSFKPVEPVGIQTNILKVQKVVLCAEDHDI
jgi:hypothetical protein